MGVVSDAKLVATPIRSKDGIGLLKRELWPSNQESRRSHGVKRSGIIIYIMPGSGNQAFDRIRSTGMDKDSSAQVREG